MADKNLQSITFPGLTDKYVVPQVDNTLTQAGRPADAKKTGDEISSLKNDFTDIETDISTGNMTAGTAKQLLANTGLTDKSPYLFRAMPTGAGDREEPVVVGGSVVWNQLANFSPSSIPSASNGITYSSVDGKSVTFSGTADNTENRTGWFGISDVYFSTRVGHNILLLPKIISGSFENGTIKYALFATPLVDFSIPTIKKVGQSTPSQRIATNVASGTVANDFTVTFICIDLTEMFGTTIADYIFSLEQATAGAGVVWLKKYGFFTKDYYPYTEPTFKHVEGLTAHKMVGFNQWDEVYEIGGINSSGENESGANRIRSKNYIPVVPGAQYYANFTDTGFNFYTRFYDADKNYVGLLSYISHPSTIAVPNNAYYLRFFVYKSNWSSSYGTDLLININLSDPAKNGTYEPYTAHTYPLDTDVVLRGIPKLDANNNLYFDGDVYKPDGTAKRKYLLNDMGTWNWQYVTNDGDPYFAAYPVGKKSGLNILCSAYPTASTTGTASLANKQIGASGTSVGVFIRDDTYTDAATFKTAMSGKYIVYELATPTTETADPYAPLQLADPYGTEEWVLDDEAFPMPVGQETFYPENLRAKIEGLPWNFANLIAPTEVSNVATRAYSTGQLFIVNNTLYQATTSIASGGTITPGTNCTATTLAEIISAL